MSFVISAFLVWLGSSNRTCVLVKSSNLVQLYFTFRTETTTKIKKLDLIVYTKRMFSHSEYFSSTTVTIFFEITRAWISQLLNSYRNTRLTKQVQHENLTKRNYKVSGMSDLPHIHSTLYTLTLHRNSQNRCYISIYRVGLFP